MDFWHFSSGDCGTSGSYVWVGGLAWTGIWDLKRGFCWHWGRGVFSWCCLPSNHLLVNGRYRDMNCSRVGHFGFGCPALRCSPWVGLLLRWSHSCLFVECPYFVSRPPPQRPLSLTLPSSSCFYPKLHFPSGGLGPLDIWEKVMLFVIFLAGFSLCSDIVQECMMGNGRAIHFCLNSTLYYSVDQFQQGFRGKGKGWRAKERIGSGHQQFFVLFDF